MAGQEAETAMIELARARDLMTRDVVTAHPDDSVATLARRLAERRVSALPVCDRDGTLRGIVTEGDLIRPLGAANALGRWWIDLLQEGGEAAPAYLEFVRLRSRRAAEVMTRDVVTVSEDATVAEIAELMQLHGIKRVPVVREGRLVGLVARADLIRALAGS
jgi:CBS domain-containing protein